MALPDSSDSIGELLYTAVNAILHKSGSAEDTCKVLESSLHHRMSSTDELLSILKSEQVQEFFGKEVLEQTEEAEEDTKVEKHVFSQITKTIAKKRLKTSQAAIAKKKAAQSKRRAVQFPSDDTWTSEEAVKYLPDGFRIYKDTFNGRWRVNSKGNGWNQSRSWRTHGGDSACMFQLMTASWAYHLACNPNETCPWDFGEELPV